MSPCQCADPYALLNLLYGTKDGAAAGDTLRQLLPATPAAAVAPVDENHIALSTPTQKGLSPNELLIHNIDLLVGSPDYHNPQDLLAVTQTLLDDVQHGARLFRLQSISRAWGNPPHQPQNVLILGFLRAALLLADPNVLVAAELEAPLAVRAPYFGNGENAAHLIETGELPWLLLDTFTREESDSLQAWVNDLRLPITDITFLHRLAWPNRLSAPLTEELLNEARLISLQSALADRDAQPRTFLNALAAAAPQLPPELSQRRALAAHAILLALTGLPALDSASRAIPELDALLHARAASPAFSPWGAQMGFPCGDACLGLARIAPNGAMAFCITNLSAHPQHITALDAAALGFTGEWRDLLSGDVMNLIGEEWRNLEGYQSRWWVKK